MTLYVIIIFTTYALIGLCAKWNAPSRSSTGWY
jgi:hypothetical protein